MGRSVLSSGSLISILKSERCNGLLRVEKEAGPKKDETRIYPNIPLIQKVVQDKKSENLALRDGKLLWFRGPGEMVTKVRAPPPESVSISEGTFAPRL